MPGLFIDVVIDPAVGGDPEIARKLEEACPVGIFKAGPGGAAIVEENLDECVLCDLCLRVGPPGAVRIRKLYEE
jgi:NAD-dependent dihydropyrimidine dehydrogenase PreA subunit